MSLPTPQNLEYIEAQYESWKKNPQSVPRDWRFFFEGFELAGSSIPEAPETSETPETPETPEAAESADLAALGGECTEEQVLKQSRVEALKYRYRDLGHLLACLDPLSACPTDHPLLNLEGFGLSESDLDTEFFTRRFAENRRAELREIIQTLRQTYCRSIGVEYMHIQDPEERRWLRERMEPVKNAPDLSGDQKRWILQILVRANRFEQYLHRKYKGQTRFSLEGAESVIPLLDTLVYHAAAGGAEEIILGMAHRGRLNVTANVLEKPAEEIFREFANSYEPDSIVGEGDVKYHNGYLATISKNHGSEIRIYLMSNPSHLESVDPVVEGFCRARQEILKDENRNRVIPLLIHGDAAFAGQGIVAETLNMSQLTGYKTGGTFHLIINNQIGYTTLPEDARSTRYSTDVAKMLMAPVFHVHGENPEAVVFAAKLALDYRNAFGKDVVVDLVCYRRYGHNEGDEPYFTQPRMYERIKDRPPVHEIYGKQLAEAGVVGEQFVTEEENKRQSELESAFDEMQNNPLVYPKPKFFENWKGYTGAYSHDPVETAVSTETLASFAETLNSAPEGFSLHSKLERLFKKRREAVDAGEGIDWANAESLAFASILQDGDPVRLSGQDCGRGTFSQRHAVIHDTKTGDVHVPLNTLGEGQGRFSVYNSLLSETGVLGYEYGYAAAQPRGLTVWEAQFGDFANNAQSIIDLYITSGEIKWHRPCGLTMLLPHGLEGLGPEHSSARMERFLQLCAGNNIQVVNSTTPAQYFHLLRRQAVAGYRKPLIVMTPKSLLRHPEAVSTTTDFTEGTFQPVLTDTSPDFSTDPENVERVLLLSGKIYYELVKRRRDLELTDVAVLRIEQIYPFPEEALQAATAPYKNAKQWFWVQEEPENMGAWTFLRPRLESVIGESLTYIGRNPSPTPATGFANIYRQVQSRILDTAVGQSPKTKRGQHIVSG